MKKIFVLLCFILFTKSVFAADSSIYGFLEEVSKILFGGEGIFSDIAFIRLGLFLLVFAVLLWASKSVIENKAAGIIVSLVMSLIGVRFLPESWVLMLGTVFRFILLWIVIIIGFPYVFVSRIFRPGWFRRIVLFGIYVVIFIFLLKIKDISVGSRLVDDTLYYLKVYSWHVKIVGVVILCIIMYFLVLRTSRISPEEYAQKEEWRRHKERMALEKRKMTAERFGKFLGGLKGIFRRR